MPETVFGLPTHPFVVHAVVVLLPLAALGAIAIAVRFGLRERFGMAVLVIAVVAAAAVPAASRSGESLAAVVGRPEQHIEYGELVKFAAIPLVLSLLALLWLSRSAASSGSYSGTLVVRAVRFVVVAAAVASIVLVVLAGHSGTEAVWGPIIDASS